MRLSTVQPEQLQPLRARAWPQPTGRTLVDPNRAAAVTAENCLVRITFDPEADAIHISLRDAVCPAGETSVTDDGVIVDTETTGQPRSYELLRVRSQRDATAQRIAGLPAPVRTNLEAFIESGALDSKTFVQQEFA